MAHPDELIRRYVDGELEYSMANALRAHLDECARCRHNLAALERLDARLSDLDHIVPPRDFAAQVQARATTLAPPRHAPRWHWPLAGLLALCGTLALVVANDQLLALAARLLGAASDLSEWTMTVLGGANSLSAGTALLGLRAGPALVLGLCMLGLAGLIVLRRSLENPLEA
jgi:anti-sigma factor RsiW